MMVGNLCLYTNVPQHIAAQPPYQPVLLANVQHTGLLERPAFLHKVCLSQLYSPHSSSLSFSSSTPNCALMLTCLVFHSPNVNKQTRPHDGAFFPPCLSLISREGCVFRSWNLIGMSLHICLHKLTISVAKSLNICRGGQSQNRRRAQKKALEKGGHFARTYYNPLI